MSAQLKQTNSQVSVIFIKPTAAGPDSADHLVLSHLETIKAVASNSFRTGSNDTRFYVHDRNSGRIFLVDAGAQMSIIPPTTHEKLSISSLAPIVAVNGTHIRT